MTRPLVLLLFAAFLLSSHAVSAKPKVALTQIEGDASGDLRDAVAEALEGKELSLIGSREVNRAVDKLGDLADLTEKDFKKLASELEADAIIAGKLDKVGRAKTLKFRLYVRKKMAKGFTVSFKDAKSEKFRSLLHDKMVDKIGATVGDDGGDGDPRAAAPKPSEDDDALAAKKDKKDKKSGKKAKADDDEEVRPRKAKAGEDEDAKPARKPRADEDEDTLPPRRPRSDDTTGPASDDAESAGKTDGEDEDAPRKAKKKVATSDDGEEVETGVAVLVEPPHTANRAAVRLDVGVSMLQRTFEFNTDGLGAEVPNKPKNSSLQPVPGVRFETEIYPLGFSTRRGALSGFGIGVEYDKTIKLTLTSDSEPSVVVPVKQSHYSAGLRYRLVFGKTATSPTLTFGAGYGKRLFSSDRSKLTMQQAVDDINRDTPTSEFTVIDPGVMFRYPVTRMVAFAAGGRGMVIINAGSIQNSGSYGRARVYGVEGSIAADVVFGNRFALRLAGEIAQVAFQFQGVGELSNSLDGNTSTRDVKALTDRSIGGSATLAVMY